MRVVDREGDILEVGHTPVGYGMMIKVIEKDDLTNEAHECSYVLVEEEAVAVAAVLLDMVEEMRDHERRAEAARRNLDRVSRLGRDDQES
jgi:hypothetical protein